MLLVGDGLNVIPVTLVSQAIEPVPSVNCVPLIRRRLGAGVEL